MGFKLSYHLLLGEGAINHGPPVPARPPTSPLSSALAMHKQRVRGAGLLPRGRASGTRPLLRQSPSERGALRLVAKGADHLEHVLDGLGIKPYAGEIMAP